ncbi:metal-dependent phosphohydrolase [Micromonospora sp. DH14]|uniref:metal-dependent phosphohydrolase n=1 Tax=Micromonospora sp. DH14 TaxID=3040120 RepID=UPI00244121DE|nr:metal-dependent phosphohydrolase [Micromonospora sp. DH14]MDG9674783.1 metal-dependent phosphohydrolase [Micromonospora sp. DH14]
MNANGDTVGGRPPPQVRSVREFGSRPLDHIELARPELLSRTHHAGLFTPLRKGPRHAADRTAIRRYQGMPVLSPPRPADIERALRDARTWCAGHTIDDRPALVHALRVAVTIGQHVLTPAQDVIIAALLHDVPEFAAAEADVYQTLTADYGSEAARIIAALQVEHRALDEPDPPIRVDDQPVLLASTADKIVALTSLLRRAHSTGNATDFFDRRPVLCGLLPHFRAFQRAAHPRLPASMSAHLDAALTPLERATARAHGAGAR